MSQQLPAQYLVHKENDIEDYATLGDALAVVNASTTGGTLYLPAGVTIVSDPVPLKSGVELMGVGAEGSAISIDNGTDDVIRLEGDGITLKNLTLLRDDEIEVTATTGGAINLNGHDFFLMDGVGCANHAFGVYVRDPDDDVNEDDGDPQSQFVTIIDSVISQVRTACIFGDESSTTTQGSINGLTIQKSLLRLSYGEGIHYYNSHPTNPNYFGFSWITGTRGPGVTISANNAFFDHCYVNTTGGPGIEMFNMKRGSINNCNVFGSGACIAEPTSETWEPGQFQIEDAAIRRRYPTGGGPPVSPPGISLGLSFARLESTEGDYLDSLGTLDDVQVVNNLVNWNAGFGIMLIGRDDDEGTTGGQNIRILDNSVHTNGRGSIDDCASNDPTDESAAIAIAGRLFGAYSNLSHISVIGNRCYNDPTLIGNTSFLVPWPQQAGIILVGEMNHVRVKDNDFVDNLHSVNLYDFSTGSPNVISDNFD